MMKFSPNSLVKTGFARSVNPVFAYTDFAPQRSCEFDSVITGANIVLIRILTARFSEMLLLLLWFFQINFEPGA